MNVIILRVLVFVPACVSDYTCYYSIPILGLGDYIKFFMFSAFVSSRNLRDVDNRLKANSSLKVLLPPV